MPVTLNFGNYQNYTLNESRLAHLLSADKEKATHMGRWDKLQDHFRSEKKRPCAGSATQHYSRSGPWGTWRDGR
ncbi:secreted protein in the Sop family; transferred to eukaryotic cells [Salmonella enterica subsp. arizonae]|nr:secreted protein in the Sop family; transferred to eukaryotic cells [Salmonella enterica subsp. arizonae]